MTKHFVTGGLALTVAALLSTTVQAKTLVYCSEGSPEGFNPTLYTAGTTFDASSNNVFDRLVDFERGTTTLGPALARELAGLGRWS